MLLVEIQVTSIFAPLKKKVHCYMFSSSGQMFNNYIQLYTVVEKRGKHSGRIKSLH